MAMLYIPSGLNATFMKNEGFVNVAMAVFLIMMPQVGLGDS